MIQNSKEFSMMQIRQAPNPIAEIIKKKYLENDMEKFEMFRTEIINLARQIKIWLIIANAKGTFKNLKYEDFFGWTQQIATLRLIAIDGVKICEGITYIKSVIGNTVSVQQCLELIQHSRLSNRFKSVRKIVEPLIIWRNKRYAHFENQTIEGFKCNLEELLSSLVNLDNSLGYISHYLLNPRLIIDEEWDFFIIKDIIEITESSYLIEYLENDPAIKACKIMLQELNEKIKTQ